MPRATRLLLGAATTALLLLPLHATAAEAPAGQRDRSPAATRRGDTAPDPRARTRGEGTPTDGRLVKPGLDVLGQRKPPSLWGLREALPAPQIERDPNAPIVDVAAEAALESMRAADLDPNIDVQITQEIIDKATELGSVEAMYEFVRNEFRFEAYYGSQKGSVETLRQRAGNDYDLASLLIALLRASGVPARYAEGDVEMSADRAASWLGVDAADVAGSILFTNGMEGISIVSAGTTCCQSNATAGCDDPTIEACVCASDSFCCTNQWDQQCANEVDSFGCAVCADLTEVVAVRAHRVWVEAMTTSGFGGPTWVPLDPAFKLHAVESGIDIPEEMGLDAQAFVDDYWDPADPMVTLPRPEMILDTLTQDVQGYLDTNHPGLVVDDVLRTTTIVPQNLGGLLPTSLPYTVRSRDGSFPEIPAARRYQIRFHMYDGGTTLIDHTFDLPTIAGRRVTVDYVGTTPADQATIDAAGGIYQTDPATVDLSPVLRLEGQDVVVATAGVGMGLQHGSDIHFLAPVNGGGLPQNVVPAIFNTITTGAAQAFGFAVNGVADTLLTPPPADDTEGLASLRFDTAMDYLANVRNADKKLAELMHAHVETGVANAILENVVRVTFDGFGVPQSFDWVGLRVDADRSVVGVWPVDRLDPPGGEPKDFLVIGGAEGSLYESRIYEDGYGQDSVSTIKILQLAVDAGIPVYKRWSSIPLPANTLSTSDRTQIENAILSGQQVTFPADPMTIGIPGNGQWTGTGWIAMDPADGAAGYIISGGNNGGATVEAWPPEFIDLSEDDKSIQMVEIEIVTPDADSPDPDAIFTRDMEENLTFEYRVHVTYDDASTKTLPGGGGTYTKTTRNTTKTFVPGNYRFHVWISRRVWWIFNATVAQAHRDVSIVGVLLRGPDTFIGGLVGTCGSDPDRFVPMLPAASGFSGVEVQACVYPDEDPSGGPMAQSYQWSGNGKTSFSDPAARVTMIEGTTPSAALDDEEIDLVVGLPGGKQVNGYRMFDFARGSMDEKLAVTVYKAEIEYPEPPPLDNPANAMNIGNEFTFSAADPGVVTVRCQAKLDPAIDEVKDEVDDKLKWSIPDISTNFIGLGGWSWSRSWGLFSGAGKGHGIDTPLEATESGLPGDNDDFGPRTVTLELEVDGTLYEADTTDIEVFFPRDATNHPGGSDPNWFYYWRQVRDNPNMTYNSANPAGGATLGLTQWNYNSAPDKDDIEIGTQNPGAYMSYGVGEFLSGIDRFIGTLIHEECHVDQIVRADPLVPSSGSDSFRYGWSWNQTPHNHWTRGTDGQWGVAGADDDGNGTTDDAATTPPFEPGQGDDVSLDHPSWFWWPNAWPLPVPNTAGHPIESECVNYSDARINEHDHAGDDWADPGKQHLTNNLWND